MCPFTSTSITFSGAKNILLMHHKQNSHLKLLTKKKMSVSTVNTVQITELNESRFREEAVDIFRVKKAAKRSFLCRDRREFGSLQFTIGNLKKKPARTRSRNMKKTSVIYSGFCTIFGRKEQVKIYRQSIRSLLKLDHS